MPRILRSKPVTADAGFARLVERACRAVSARHPLPASSTLTCVLTDDAEIRQLNAQFRGKDKPTNVLAFPATSLSPSGEGGYLGDIIISADTVRREAKEQGKTFDDHLTHLLVHAFLHLLGHDHASKREALAMEKIEISILSSLGIANPYELG